MADRTDPFSLNVEGVAQLVGSNKNKNGDGVVGDPEGIVGEKYDALSVKMSDVELLALRNEFEQRYAPYESKLKPRVDKNRESYLGKKKDGQYLVDTDVPIAANLQFESMETFLAAALAKGPDPVVWCDNTPEGNAISNAIKTMLQFHADQLVLKRKFAIMVRQWATDLLGVLKPGWNPRINDIDIDNRQVRDYIFDPSGYVNAYGDFSSWYGERITITAEKLAEQFPKHKAYIDVVTDGKLGTDVTYTEWWPSDEFCFYTFKDVVLDKFKNPYFNYPEPVKDILTGENAIDQETGEVQMTTPHNHFAHPKKPGIFLSVYTLREQPHDITSNLEQNIGNQNVINRRTQQIDYNISSSNGGYAYSQDNFNEETARQAATARAKGNPILIPSGGPIDRAILPLPAQSLPNDTFNNLEITKADLRTSWGVQGITAEPQDEDQTARGMILNQAHDTSRIGGGIGDAVEQVADNVFNWLVQLYTVFYDEEHFAAVMGRAKAVEYITLSSQSLDRQVVVSVAPNSMRPKDEVTMMNLAQALFDKGAIGPKTLLKMLDWPDVEESAADGVMYKIDPMGYFQLNFPEYAQRLQQQHQAQGVAMNTQAEGMVAPEQITEPMGEMSRQPSSAALSNVPLQP